MKRKCSFCGTEFEFKAKDLELSESQKGSYYRLKNNTTYYVKCPFCFTPKRVLYNHKPRHINIIKGSE